MPLTDFKQIIFKRFLRLFTSCVLLTRGQRCLMNKINKMARWLIYNHRTELNLPPILNCKPYTHVVIIDECL